MWVRSFINMPAQSLRFLNHQVVSPPRRSPRIPDLCTDRPSGLSVDSLSLLFPPRWLDRTSPITQTTKPIPIPTPSLQVWLSTQPLSIQSLSLFHLSFYSNTGSIFDYLTVSSPIGPTSHDPRQPTYPFVRQNSSNYNLLYIYDELHSKRGATAQIDLALFGRMSISRCGYLLFVFLTSLTVSATL